MFFSSFRHPSLRCSNIDDVGTPTLLCAFRNYSDNEAKILKCSDCHARLRSGCDFKNGELRLRLVPNGLVKIVCRLWDKRVPIVIRDISETNFGIKTQAQSGQSVNASRPQVVVPSSSGATGGRTTRDSRRSTPESSVTRPIIIVVDSDDSSPELGHQGKAEEGDEALDRDSEVVSDPEGEESSERRKRKRPSSGEDGSEANGVKTSELDLDPGTAPGRTQASTQVSTSTSGSTPAGDSNRAGGRTEPERSAGSSTHSDKSTPAVQSTRPSEVEAADPSADMDIDKMLEELEKKNKELKLRKIQKLKAENEALQRSLV